MLKIRIESLPINHSEDEYLSQLGSFENETIIIEKRVLPELGVRHFVAVFLHEFTHYLYSITKREHKDDETLAERVERLFLNITGIKYRYFD